MFVLDQPVAKRLLGVRGGVGKARHTVDHIHCQMEPIKIVAHDHVERCCGRPLLLEAADMKIGVVGSPVGQPVNEVRIAMEGKDDWLVSSEQAVEVVVTEAVWMFAPPCQRR